MKKLTALAGVLLLSSSLLTACGGQDAQQGASPDNRKETYDTSRGGRVMDTRDNAFTDNRTGREAKYKYGVRGAQPGAPNPRGGAGLGAGLGGALGGGMAGLGLGNGNTADKDRLGVRDNIGPDSRPFATADRALESRVEALPGIRNATVVVSGNTAYVAIDRGTDATRNNTYSYGANTPGDRSAGTTGTGNQNMSGTTGTGNTMGGTSNTGTRNNTLGLGGGDNNTFGLSDDLRNRVTSTVKAANPQITNVNVTANPAVMNRMDNLLRGAGNNTSRGLNDIGTMFGGGTGAGAGAAGTGTTAGTTAGTGTAGMGATGIGAGTSR